MTHHQPHKEFESSFLETLSYQTPFFLFSKQRIVDNYRQFKDLFPQTLIYYAMKANSEPDVLSILSNEGCGFEVASKFELDILKKLNVKPEKMIFGSAIKSTAHIREFFEYGVNTFSFDSFQEAEKIAAVARGSRVFVRLITNDSGSVFKFSEKFGTDLNNIVPLLVRAKEVGLRPSGISFHVGSQQSDAMAWSQTLESLIPILKELKEKNIELEMINLGGGYPCKYINAEAYPSLSEISENTLKSYRNLPYQPQLIAEPGRGIIGDTGILVTTVVARVKRKEFTWLFLDAGCYNALFETMAYQGSTRYPATCIRSISTSGESLFALAGPTGDSEDVISRETLLPSDIDVGDKVVFHNIGAYTLSVSTSFNGFPRPQVYYI